MFSGLVLLDASDHAWGEEKASVFLIFHTGNTIFLDIVCKTWKTAGAEGAWK